MALLWWPESCFQVPSHFLQHFTTAQMTTYAAIAWRDGIEVAQEPPTHFSIHITFLLIMSSRLKRQDLKTKNSPKNHHCHHHKNPSWSALCFLLGAREETGAFARGLGQPRGRQPGGCRILTVPEAPGSVRQKLLCPFSCLKGAAVTL